MAPQTRTITKTKEITYEEHYEEIEHQKQTTEGKAVPLEIRWRNVILFVLIHLGAIYSLTLLPFVHPFTILLAFFTFWNGANGITAGAHRLWTHRSYRARLPLRIFLAIAQSMAFQNDIIEWSRDHRVHHKFSETDADPHNAKRGFFFAHCGWLMCRKHPAVKEKGKLIDISDITSDPVCAFQRKVYLPSVVLISFVLPTLVPWYFWGETLWNAYFVSAVLRCVCLWHVTWLVNSAAHLWGNRPYDKHINPSENVFVSIGAWGEGFHNYHHTFPHDYAASEWGHSYNVTTAFIDLMAWIGLAYDRKSVPKEVTQQRMKRTGDGSVGYGLIQSLPSIRNNAS